MISALAEQPVIFDASASYSPIGTIVSYAWNFGDGQTVVTTNLIIFYTYYLPEDYIVTLTVTNSAGTSVIYVFSGQTLLRNGGPLAVSSQSIQIPLFIFPATHVERKQKIKHKPNVKQKS